MGSYVASEVIKLMLQKDISIKKSDVLVLGIAFKENCPDIRNTKVVDVIKELKEYGVNVTIFDPWVNKEEVKKEYNLEAFNILPNKKFDAIVLTVAHEEFLELNYFNLRKENAIIYDVKNKLSKSIIDKSL